MLAIVRGSAARDFFFRARADGCDREVRRSGFIFVREKEIEDGLYLALFDEGFECCVRVYSFVCFFEAAACAFCVARACVSSSFVRIWTGRLFVYESATADRLSLGYWVAQ